MYPPFKLSCFDVLGGPTS